MKNWGGKQRYAASFDVVTAVIHNWDPYGLLALGCRRDEFDAEIAAIVRQIERIASPQDAAHAISRVFSSAFEPQRFQVADCAAVGQELYKVLAERDLLTKRIPQKKRAL